MTWKTIGPDFNEWNTDFLKFAQILEDAKGEGWWGADFDLKYLDIRVDTRYNTFLVYGNKGKVSPDRVIAAIEKWRN